MKINRLFLKDGLLEETLIDFSDWSLIFSEDNSSGKTTLIRFILFSLGFDVPSTKGLNIKKYETEIELETKGRNYTIFSGPSMHGFKVKDNISNKSTYLSSTLELHSLIFNVKNKKLLENILGTFYFDQEHGLMNWNKGTVIGENKFRIRDFLVGVSDIDLSDEYGVMNELKKERDTYLAFSQFKKKTGSPRSFNISSTDKDELLGFENKKSYLKYTLQGISSKIIEYENMLKDSNDVSKFISNMQLFIKRDIDNVPFLLNEKDILHLDDSKDWLKANILDLKEKTLQIKEDIAGINYQINKRKNLFDDFVSSTIEEVTRKTSEVQITEGQILSVIDNLKDKIDVIEQNVEKTIRRESEKNISFINYLVESYGKELLPEDKLHGEIISELLFLKRNDKYSGRILSHLSYAFHLAYIALIDNLYNIKLPIIIDSPTSNELTIENFEKVLDIIKRDFNDHNLIIASIYKYGDEKLKTIKMRNKLFDSRYYKAE